MSRPAIKTTPEQRAKYLHFAVGNAQMTSAISTLIADVELLEKQLTEADNVICWGVACVHEARALDKSYDNHVAIEKARDAAENRLTAAKFFLEMVLPMIVKEFGEDSKTAAALRKFLAA
jgi:hypothetical protein